MCGRYFLDVDFDDLLTKFDIDTLMGSPKLKGDIFPTDNVVTIVQRKGIYKAVSMQWGIKTPYLKRVVINARTETVFQKPLFNKAILTRRAIVPANSYYEWQTNANGDKIKYRISLKTTELSYLLGLYNVYRHKNTFYPMVSILTMDANKYIKTIHSRMPVMLGTEQARDYLSNHLNLNNVCLSNIEQVRTFEELQ